VGTSRNETAGRRQPANEAITAPCWRRPRDNLTSSRPAHPLASAALEQSRARPPRPAKHPCQLSRAQTEPEHRNRENRRSAQQDHLPWGPDPLREKSGGDRTRKTHGDDQAADHAPAALALADRGVSSAGAPPVRQPDSTARTARPVLSHWQRGRRAPVHRPPYPRCFRCFPPPRPRAEPRRPRTVAPWTRQQHTRSRLRRR